MKPVQTFTVVPNLPPALERLRDLAYNLRWSWNHEVIALFRRVDRDLWESTNHNPVAMLGLLDQERLDELAADAGFLADLEHAANDLDHYLGEEQTWFRTRDGFTPDGPVAYFSAEFGVTECLAIFAGGLGVLAGDHLKSASDLNVPLVGIGLAYQQGYFKQSLDASGRQQEHPVRNDFDNLPLTLERNDAGEQVVVSVPFPGRTVNARIWRAQVGRVPLYLLDANLPGNDPADREITARLYDGNPEMRIRQEVMLGIGGYRALEALGIVPSIYHMNEGHAAFLALEHVSRLMERHGLTFAEAREMAAASLVFTSHTPVSAGHDRFSADLMNVYFGEYMVRAGISSPEFMALGRENPFNEHEMFTMTVLALRLSTFSNGVSPLHGAVTRAMFQQIWPEVPQNEIPIGHVSNGIHLSSWISRNMDSLYRHYLGERYSEEPANKEVWEAIDRIPDEELWSVRQIRRNKLVEFTRDRVRIQRIQRGAPPREVNAASDLLDPNVLTIGFARRFATYKRATLLLRDLDRLARIINNPDRPVQILFSGKAHPRDEGGKDLIQQIANLTAQEPFSNRMVILEDYDMAVARYLVQGCDVWLNNPRRPWEASGTSGMKASANGVLNLSTLDGWWDEAWEDATHNGIDIGWAIGRGETYEDTNYQDQLEAEALYDLLEYEVVPAFYERDDDGLPQAWLERMRASLKSICYFFNTNRMVQQYVTTSYLPAAERAEVLRQNAMEPARELAAWRRRVETSWPEIVIEQQENVTAGEYPAGSQFEAAARVHLPGLSPDDVEVQLVAGQIDSQGELVNPTPIPMELQSSDGDSWHTFKVTTPVLPTGGRQGYTLRVVPRHQHLVTPFLPGCIRWVHGE
jgi:starch phosphorylase